MHIWRNPINNDKGAVTLGRRKFVDNQAMRKNNISSFDEILIDNFYQEII